MKTSVMEVHDMLSVLSVDGVEKRIGEVPGVESVTVNYAAGSATVRYDETRLDIPDIKSAVRQSGYESTAPDAIPAGVGHEGHTAPGTPPKASVPAAPKTPPVASATAGAASAGAAQQKGNALPETGSPTTPKPSPAAPETAPSPTSAAQKSAPGAAAAAPATSAPAAEEPHNKDKS
jgi:Cu2+-exporting ATPase